MGNSTEYPDLPFVPPRAYGKGRDGHQVQVVVIHYTAGSERSTSAEDGAAYDQRRTDGTSTHYFHDSDSTVQCVYTWDRANAALRTGNRIGIQHELCGTQQTRAQWLDPASAATITRAARQVARDCAKYAIPIRKLTPEQVRAGQKGICGHADITLAFPADGGDHMDPGTAFPWDVLLAEVGRLAGTVTASSQEVDVAFTDKEERDIVFTLLQAPGGPVHARLDALTQTVGGLAAKVDALTKTQAAGGVDPDAVAAKVAALLAPEIVKVARTAINGATIRVADAD